MPSRQESCLGWHVISTNFHQLFCLEHGSRSRFSEPHALPAIELRRDVFLWDNFTHIITPAVVNLHFTRLYPPSPPL